MNDIDGMVHFLERATRILRTAVRDARAGCAADAVLESVDAGFADLLAAKKILEKRTASVIE